MASRWVVALLVASSPALADSPGSLAAPERSRDRAFPFTWDSATLAPSEMQPQVWFTPRVQRYDPDPYLQSELRAGLAAGLTPAVDTLLLVDATITDQVVRGSEEDRRISARITSWWRYSFLKATDVIGFAGLARASLGVDGIDLEARLVLDKQLGPILLALNSAVTFSPLWNGVRTIDLRLEQNAALGYRIGPVMLGLEARVRTAFERRDYQGTALYGGPSLTWSTKWFFISLAWHAQLGADKAPGDRGNGEAVDLRDNERFTGRIMFGGRIPAQ